MAAKKKAAAKPKKQAAKKKPVKKGAAKPVEITRASIGMLAYMPVGAALLIAAIPLLLPLVGVSWKGCSSSAMWFAMLSGVATGISGNPLMVDVLPGILGLFSSLQDTAAIFPAQLLAEKLPGGLHLVIVSLVLGGAALIPAAKGKMMKYEPVLLIPSLGLLGMVFAFRARSMAPMFNDLFTGILDSMYFTGMIVLLLLVLVMMRWIYGSRSRFAHWGWSVAAGPLAGFWVGYIGPWWPFVLAAILLFIYCFIIDEDPVGIACGLPLMYAPLAGAKILMSNFEGWENIVTSSELWSPPVIVALLSMAAAHLCAIYILRMMPEKTARGVFSATTVLFLLFSIYRLF